MLIVHLAAFSMLSTRVHRLWLHVSAYSRRCVANQSKGRKRSTLVLSLVVFLACVLSLGILTFTYKSPVEDLKTAYEKAEKAYPFKILENGWFRQLQAQWRSNPGSYSVALGVPAKSPKTWASGQTTYLEQFLLPSLVKTTQRYTDRLTKAPVYYFVLIGYDRGDPALDDPLVRQRLLDLPILLGYPIAIQFVEFAPHNGWVSYVWSALFKISYEVGLDYYYMMNDDMVLRTPGWALTMIKKLQSNVITNLGVVSAMDYRPIVGNWSTMPGTMTQAMVHRTHMDVIGSFLPVALKNFFCDDWLTNSYPHPYTGAMLLETWVENKNPGRGVDIRYNIATPAAGVLKQLTVQAHRAVADWVLQHDVNAPITGVFVILAGTPIEDSGGASRFAQLALSAMSHSHAVIYMHRYGRGEMETVQLPQFRRSHLHVFSDPRGTAPATVVNTAFAYGVRPASITVLVEFPHKDFLPHINEFKRQGAVVIYELIDNWWSPLGSWWYSAEVEERVISIADALTASAPDLKEHLRSRAPTQHVEFVPNALDHRLFNRRQFFPRPSALPDGKIVMYAGSLWGDWFDWDIIDEISNLKTRVPDLYVVLIGDYNDYHRHKHPKHTRNTQSNVIMEGLVAQHELPAYYQWADVLIIPWRIDDISLSTSPLKIYEYVAMDTAVVSTQLPTLNGVPGVSLVPRPHGADLASAKQFARVVLRELSRSAVTQERSVVHTPASESLTTGKGLRESHWTSSLDEFVDQHTWTARFLTLQHLSRKCANAKQNDDID